MAVATGHSRGRVTAPGGLAGFLDSLGARNEADGGLAHVENIPPRAATYGSLDKPLPHAITRALSDRGIERLYSHQADALNLLHDGAHVIVATSTASGKSMCYNLPVLKALIGDPSAGALYMFPTKALAHDQLGALRELAPDEMDLVANAYDGDTPRPQRRAIRSESQVIVTNPDMVHAALLPFHRGWRRFLSNLRYVVVDEGHYYRGVFGTHVALILRRLRRLARNYGADPQFVLCSATISNAGEHAKALTGLDFRVVSEDGSPSGGRSFIFWNPHEKDETAGTNMTTAEFLAELVSRGMKTIAFARSRDGVERIASMTQDKLANWNSGLVQPYRAGYRAAYRRETERKLADGRLLGLVSTNAMELGVDVGQMAATLISGYPGTVSSVWQQAGRSGRSNDRALSVLIARDHPVDIYWMENPDAFFDAPYEAARVSTDNPILLEQHLRCAALELPLSRRDFDIFEPESLKDVAGAMVKAGTLIANPVYLTRSLSPEVSQRPAFDMNIRSMDSTRWTLEDETSGKKLEDLDKQMVFSGMHPGAVRTHQGNSYLVRGLDVDEKVVKAVPVNGIQYYTSLEIDSSITVTEVLERARVGQTRVGYGRVKVTRSADHFIKKRKYDDKVIEKVQLEWPPLTFQTSAVWWEAPETRGGLIAPNALHCLRAMAYPAVAAIGMFAMCDAMDVDTAIFRDDKEAGEAGLFLYDNHPGGVGISQMASGMALGLWRRMLQIILACPCHYGCPRCVESPMSAGRDAMDKQGAIRMLQLMISERRVGGMANRAAGRRRSVRGRRN